MDINAIAQTTVTTLVAVGWKIAGAAALWLVGRWLIGFGLRMLGRSLTKAVGYLGSKLNIAISPDARHEETLPTMQSQHSKCWSTLTCPTSF